MVLVSVDDHVVEPPGLFDGRLPAKYVDLAPQFITKDDGGVESEQASTAIRDDAAFDLRQRGRWHRFTVDSTGDYALIGMAPRLKPAGYR